MPSETLEYALGSHLVANRDFRASFLADRITASGRSLARLSQSALEIRDRAWAEREAGNQVGSDQLLTLCSRLHRRQALLQQRIELLRTSLQQVINGSQRSW